MNEADKKKIKEFAAKTGKKVLAGVRLKNEKPKIIPYDGDDAYYIDVHEDSSQSDFVDKIDVTVNGAADDSSDVLGKSAEAIKKIVRDVKNRLGSRNAVKSIDDSAESDDVYIPAEDIYGEATDYFKTISRKLDGIKSGIADAMKRSESDINGGDNTKLGEYMSDVTVRLDDINAMLERGISELSASTGDIKTGVADAKSRYDEISEGIRSVTRTTEENIEKISAMSDDLDGVRNRVNEIHSTTNSIDKLYDSVFELKTANIELKNALAEMNEANKKKTIIFAGAALLIAAVSVATLVIVLL